MHSVVGSLDLYGDTVLGIISSSEALAIHDEFISMKEGEGQIQLEKVAAYFSLSGSCWAGRWPPCLKLYHFLPLIPVSWNGYIEFS